MASMMGELQGQRVMCAYVCVFVVVFEVRVRLGSAYSKEGCR